MSRRGENIRKRKDGRWEGRYIQFYDELGKAKYHSVYGKSYNEVKQKVDLAKSKLSILDKSNIHCFEHQLFKEILLQWLESNKIYIKPSTYQKYYNLITKYIIPELGNLSINQINLDLISYYLERQMKIGGIKQQGLSVSTVKSLSYLIKSSLIFAKGKKYMEHIPFPALPSKIKKEKITILSEEEEKKLVQLLLQDLDKSKLGILICLYTGLRIGEICALKWENINLTENTLTVIQTVQRLQLNSTNSCKKTELVIGTPKSINSIRTIPLPEFLRNNLDFFANFDHYEGYFLSTDKNKIMDPRTYQYRFKKYLKLAGIEPLNFHILRHTFATHCVRLGFDIKTLSELLGHSDVNITLNQYVHSSLDTKRKQMSLISSYYGQNNGQ